MNAPVLLRPPSGPPTDHDGVVVLRGATWGDLQRLLEIRGDQSAPRLTFLDGAVEIMSPSKSHEQVKSLIGRLVEVYCLERGIEFHVVGSWTLEDKAVQAAAEPDECYVFVDRQDPSAATRPDLAIEVVWTSGGLDKLEVNRRLGVREVWFWAGGALTVHQLHGTAYREVRRSAVLPALDLAQLARFLDRPTTSQAMRAYRQSLQAPRKGRRAR